MAQPLVDGSSLELQNVFVSTVKPSERKDHVEKYDVALLDLYLPDFFMPVLFLYKPDPESHIRLSGSEFLRRLKESLSKLLVPYYTFAGRFCKTYDHRIRQLLCNDEGVPFIEAEIDEEMVKVVSLDDFQPLPILCGHQFLNLDAVAYYQTKAKFPLPACFIQATKFRCGGISVNVNFCHQLADGKAMFQFVKDWSQMTLEGHCTNIPIHDRSLTYPVSLLESLMSQGNPEEPQVKTIGTLALDEKSLGAGEHDRSHEGLGAGGAPASLPDCADTKAPVDPAEAVRFIPVPSWASKTLHVRKASVMELKQRAMANEGGLVPTALDCIQSHIWRALSSIPSSVDNKKGSVYGIVAEGRSRMHDPAVPESYSGNAFLLLFSPPLDQPDDDPLTEANIIHNLIRSVTPQSWPGQFAKSVGILLNSAAVPERAFFTSSWYRFPMYEADFGYGKPILATVNVASSTPPSGYAVLMPPRPGSDFLASLHIVMAPEVLQAMLENSEFRSFFH